MAVRREVLVELVDVESVDGPDDVGAEVRDVYVAEVNVLAAGRGGGASVGRPVELVLGSRGNVGLWCSRRRWRPLRLTWEPEPRKHQTMSTNANEHPLKQTVAVILPALSGG